MCLQLADQSVCYPAGIAEDILVRVQDFLIPVDFVVLVTPVFPKKNECISYVCQDLNFTHMIDS
jgi:hypothetical protein